MTFERPLIERLVSRPLPDVAFRRKVRAAYEDRLCHVGFARLRNGGGRPDSECRPISRPVERQGSDLGAQWPALSGHAALDVRQGACVGGGRRGRSWCRATRCRATPRTGSWSPTAVAAAQEHLRTIRTPRTFAGTGRTCYGQVALAGPRPGTSASVPPAPLPDRLPVIKARGPRWRPR